MYVASPLKIRHIKLRAIFLIHLHIGLFSIEQHMFLASLAAVTNTKKQMYF